MRTNYLRWLALSVLLPISSALAATNLVIYSDRLENGFEDHSWVTHDLAAKSLVHSGVYSIEISSATNWQGLYFYHTNFDSTPYESVSFWARGGTEDGQEIQIQGLLDGKTPSDDTYSRVTLTTNWQQITVTLEELDVVGKTNFTGIWIQETPESPDSPFYIDDVQLNLKAPPPPVVAPPAKPAPAKSEAPPMGTNPNERTVFWIIGALGVIICLLSSLVVLFWRRGMHDPRAVRPTTVLAAPNENTGLASPEDWKQRALTAEAMAGKQGQILREKIMPELTEFAKQSLVQGLYAQRNVLLETQQQAQQALVEMEARLAKLHLPWQERVRAYEKRVAELEEEVRTQGEEVRELTRATLALVRKKLEDEKELGRISTRFN